MIDNRKMEDSLPPELYNQLREGLNEQYQRLVDMVKDGLPKLRKAIRRIPTFEEMKL